MTTYFALIDPHDPERVTSWRLTTRGLTPWPRNARVGPLSGVTRADLPADPDERSAFVRDLGDRQAAYLDTVREQIEADPDGAAALFAVRTARCCICGRALTDPASRAYGIGPDCRAGLANNVLAALASATSRIPTPERTVA